jgi:acyl-CoA reductase-like NAD-dependent aldehyde dehydrogenase
MATATLSITNPATGALILRVAADGPREVAAKYAAARRARRCCGSPSTAFSSLARMQPARRSPRVRRSG